MACGTNEVGPGVDVDGPGVAIADCLGEGGVKTGICIRWDCDTDYCRVSVVVHTKY